MTYVKATGYGVLIVGMIAAVLLATGMKVPASQLPDEAPAKEPLENMGNAMTAMAILFGVGLVVAVFLMATGRMPSASIRW
jgi:hypothetical protein